MPMIPGGLTPTEVFAAWRSGVPAVKVFPVSVGGPELIRGLRGPFPDIPLIPTGGITAPGCRRLPRGRRCGGRGWRLAHRAL